MTDADGRPTTDPVDAYALSPLGGYKGQGLAMAVTLLAGVLTGSPLDWQLSQVGEGTPGQGRGVGHFLLALDPHAFSGQRDFSAGLADLLGTVRSAAPADRRQPVLAPGDPQRAHERQRRLCGIPLDARTAEIFSALATKLGLPAPAQQSSQMRRWRRDSRIDQPSPGRPAVRAMAFGGEAVSWWRSLPMAWRSARDSPRSSPWLTTPTTTRYSTPPETLPGGTRRARSWRWPKSTSCAPRGCVTSSACPDSTHSPRRPIATRSS